MANEYTPPTGAEGVRNPEKEPPAKGSTTTRQPGEYTPTTEEVRSLFIRAHNAPWAWSKAPESFDRWLAEHDKQVALKALQSLEGHYLYGGATEDTKQAMRETIAAIEQEGAAS